ncbi:hypothetical protein HHI36_005597, partial [Cryptolaemus montrouzieri]
IENCKKGTSEFFVDLRSAEVNPNKSISIDIFFSPTESKRYEETISFLVYSNKVNIKLLGIGVPLALEVLSLNDKCLDFGAVRVGKCAQRNVTVINSGEAVLDVFFALFEKLPFHNRSEGKEKNEFLVQNPMKMATP